MDLLALSVDDFPTLVEDELRSLFDEFGFVVRREKRIRHLYVGVTLTNRTSHIRIGWEPQDSSYLPVDIGTLSTADAIERHVTAGRYPLWLVAYAGGSTKAEATALENAPGESRRAVKVALRAVSLALSRYARDILSGDFSSFDLLESNYNAHMRDMAEKVGLRSAYRRRNKSH
jgi:hypothetical protein